MAFKLKPDKKQSELLKKRGIPIDDILGTAVIDMDENEAYAEIWLVLTKNALYKAALPGNTGLKTFSGYPENPVKPIPKAEELKIDRFDLALLNSATCEDMVCCGLFCADYDGQPVILGAFSGSFSDGAHRLCELINKAVKKEPLDVKEKKDEELFCPKCGTPYPEHDRKICPKCLDKRSLFMRILKYFSPYKLKLAVVVIASLIATVLSVVLPYVSGTVYFDGVLSKNPEFFSALPFLNNRWVLTLTIVMATVTLIQLLNSVCSSLQSLMIAKTVPGVVKTIKNDIFESMKSLPLKFFQNKQTGGVMTRVLYDAGEVSGFFIDGLPYLASNLFRVVAITAVMFSLNWQLAALSLVLMPMLIIFILKLQPRLWHLYGRTHRASRGMNSILNDSLTGVRVIKAFGRESAAESGFNKKNQAVASAEIGTVNYETRYVVALEGVRNLMVLLVWSLGAYVIVKSQGLDMSYGMLATFLAYVAMLSGPMEYIVNLFRWWAGSMNAAGRIFEIIDAKSDIAERPDAKVLSHPKGDVEIKNVTFSYEAGHPVLKNISAGISGGKMLGVVGRSGAGKTTLISLISRLYDPDEGEIIIDGENIKNYTLSSLRSNIGVVSQESYIFIGTVAQNIAYAKPEASWEEILSAAKAAYAHDFICKMPDGYDTLIGSGYRQLSGGEKQRISVARAILADPKILILDEATASVDTETERNIQNALDRLQKGRTTISIAHRLSTLKNADKLIVIDEGKLTESGTHEELMLKKGTYFTLAELQREALLKTKTGDNDNDNDGSADSEKADNT